MASADAYFSHAVRGVHNHVVGCSVPVRAPDRCNGEHVEVLEMLYLLNLCFPTVFFFMHARLLPWKAEIFSELPQGADDETVRRYAKTYIMMLLSTQLFGDKYGACVVWPIGMSSRSGDYNEGLHQGWDNQRWEEPQGFDQPSWQQPPPMYYEQ
ncbi:hypothetical protein AHAS_Ahas01G0189900 [Arachis hypogaea]